MDQSSKLKNMSSERLGCLTKQVLNQNFYRTRTDLLKTPILHPALQKRVPFVYSHLKCSEDTNRVGDHTGILLKVVLVCFELFACVPFCYKDKYVTTYEAPQNLILNSM